MALLDHIGVRVTDMERSLEFYTSLFGFPVVERFQRKDPDGGVVDTAALRVGGESGLFLTQQPGSAAHGREARPEHICLTFEPAEFEQVMTRIKARNAIPPESRMFPRLGMTGRSNSIDILDPDNNRIEVKNRSAEKR